MPLDRQWIEQHIPHKGRMCLLDEVLSWDATRIRCRSATHRERRQPAALARPPRRRLRHRVRRAGDGGARRADGRERAARQHGVHQRARQHRLCASAIWRACATCRCTSRASTTWRADLIAAARAHHRRWAYRAVRVLGVERAAGAAERARQHRVRRRLRTARRNTAPRMSAAARRALVTGGSGGIGGAICRRLARDGHHVYVHSHRGGAVAETLVRGDRRGGGHASAISFDITDTAATRAALETVLAAGPDPDPGQQRGRPRRRGAAGHERRAVASRDRRVGERLLQRHAAAAAAHDPHPLGPDRQRILRSPR